jgi:hypothetical protein
MGVLPRVPLSTYYFNLCASVPVCQRVIASHLASNIEHFLILLRMTLTLRVKGSLRICIFEGSLSKFSSAGMPWLNVSMWGADWYCHQGCQYRLHLALAYKSTQGRDGELQWDCVVLPWHRHECERAGATTIVGVVASYPFMYLVPTLCSIPTHATKHLQLLVLVYFSLASSISFSSPCSRPLDSKPLSIVIILPARAPLSPHPLLPCPWHNHLLWVRTQEHQWLVCPALLQTIQHPLQSALMATHISSPFPTPRFFPQGCNAQVTV